MIVQVYATATNHAEDSAEEDLQVSSSAVGLRVVLQTRTHDKS